MIWQAYIYIFPQYNLLHVSAILTDLQRELLTQMNASYVETHHQMCAVNTVLKILNSQNSNDCYVYMEAKIKLNLYMYCIYLFP